MQRIYNIKHFNIMDLQVSDSLKIIQSVINQRKQKYEENGFFLIFWSVLIMLAGVLQFAMLITNYYPKQSGFVWGIVMPLGFVVNFIIKYKEKKVARQKNYTDWLDWIWAVAGINAIFAFLVSLSPFGKFQIAILVIYLPFAFVALAMALQMKMKLWIATSLVALLLIYAGIFVPFSYEIYLPLLCVVLAALLFLVPGIQFHNKYKKRSNVR